MKESVSKYNVDEINYYFHRNRFNRPMITVCICKKGDEFSRGVSICSINDSPNKRLGRKIARDRALKALFDKEHSDGIHFRRDIRDVLNTYDYALILDYFKSEYMPCLTEYERMLMGIVPRKSTGYLNENGN